MPISLRALTLVLSASLPALAIAGPDAKPIVPAPHPLITEILFAVPPGTKGDANADGKRDAIGDEFIELTNSHDKPIQLKGYTVVDIDAFSPGSAKPKPDKPGDRPSSQPPPPRKPRSDSAQVRFTFPELELKPGETVVVFNGYKSTFSGPVGDSAKPPSGKNDRFHNAYVFTMSNTSQYAALSNEADCVILLDPQGKPLHAVHWGKPADDNKKPPQSAMIVEEAPQAVESVQRLNAGGKLVPHSDLPGDQSKSPCSPGLYVEPDRSAKPAADAKSKP
ncbi:MAG: lamin tail domain-containing protein [Phycisphaerales bacterium]|nr:lamin tail domain-containing protein [Phycisphaerales bacterium]